MPKTKKELSASLLSEIKKYLEENPNVSMETARCHFKLGRKLFYRIVHDELRMWNPKSTNQKNWPENLQTLITESFDQNPPTIIAAYKIFLTKYKDPRLVQFGTFRYFAANLGLFQQVNRKPIAYAQTDFEKIFSKHENGKSIPDNKAFRRSFLRFLKEIKKNNTLLALDTDLSGEHKFCYEKIADTMCWTCGKTEHFGAKISLEIDHISGQSLDHRLSNLRLVCPCCHRMTSTSSRKYKPQEKILSLYDNFAPSVDIAKMKKARENVLKSDSFKKKVDLEK